MLLLILTISPNNSIEYLTQKTGGPKLKELLKEYMPYFLIESEKKKIPVRDWFKISVEKSQKCRTKELGFITLACDNCSHTKKICLVCHNRLCTSCGKTACDNRTESANRRIPQHIKYIHITLTLPEELRDFWLHFRDDRVLNVLFDAAKATIVEVMMKRYKCLPGFISVIHTFGSDLKRNPHIHIIMTAGGITQSVDDRIDLREQSYFHYNFFNKTWRYFVAKLSRQFIEQSYPQYTNSFNKKLNETFKKNRYVHVGEKPKSSVGTVKYVGRYLKRPPIASANLIPNDIHKSTITNKISLRSSQIPDPRVRGIVFSSYI